MQIELLDETWVETPLLTTAGCKRIHEIKSKGKQCFWCEEKRDIQDRTKHSKVYIMYGGLVTYILEAAVKNL